MSTGDPIQAWVWFDLAAAKGDDVAAAERTRLLFLLDEEALARARRLSRTLAPSPIAQPIESELGRARAPEMVRIESGCFAMGSDPNEAGRHDNEVRRPVCVEGFSMSRYEVTRGEYAAFVRDTGREVPDGCQNLQ